MKHISCKKSIFFLAILCLALLLCLVACGESATPERQSEQTEKKVSKIEVDGTSVLTGYAGEYDIDRLRILVYYSDDTTDVLAAETSYIATTDRSKLNKEGTHQVKIVYQGCQTTATIVLTQKPKSRYPLTIVDGVPVKINGIALAEPATLTNGRFTDTYLEGTEVTIQWVEKEGYYFNRWTDNGEEVTAQSTTVVVMNESHVYVAYSDPVVHSVSFTTNNNQMIPTRSTNMLFEADLPELKKDGYVFDGWTTTPVIGDDAIDCDVRKVTFPFAVSLDTALYGTWRALGLEFVGYINEVTGRSGYIVLNYVRNDTELEIPDTYNDSPVLAIAGDAFLNATALERLFIPANVEVIEPGFLRNCSRLKNISVDASSNYFSDEEGVLYNYARDELVAYPAGLLNAVFEPDSNLRVIRSCAFYDAVLGGIVLPSSVRVIGESAFDSVHIDYVNMAALNPYENGFSLAESLFNENVELLLVNTIFRSVFSEMNAFSGFVDRITDDPSVPTISVNADRSLLYKNIFNENSDNAVSSVEIIGADRSLTSIDLPITLDEYDVSSIGYAAFNGCIYLENFSIPIESRLERVLDKAFDGTPYREKRLAADGSITANGILYKYLGTASSYNLPRGIKVIAEGAFRGNETLETIVLVSNSELTTIGPYAFYGCTSFTGSAKNGIAEEGIILKSSVRTIGNFAFAYSGLRAFDVGGASSRLRTIGQEAFRDCHYLKNISVGPQTVEISDDAFLYCLSMQAFSVWGDNDEFVAYDGVLYSKSLNSVFYDTLFAYPAGRLSAEFNVNAPDGSEVVEVAYIGNYSLFMANILSLYLPESVRSVSANSIYIPGLISLRFESINQGITYDDMFIKTDARLAVGKWEPEYVTVMDLTSENTERSIQSFFGNDNGLREEKYRENEQTVFIVSDDGNMVYRDFGSYATVARFARDVSEAVIPDRIDDKNVSQVDAYAFSGYYLSKVALGLYVTTLEPYSMSDAYSLRHVFTHDNAIADITDKTFGDAFNDGLFVYIPIEKESAYVNDWGVNAKYLIDNTQNEPRVSFVYYPGEEAEEIAPMYGEITSDSVPVPTRVGYDFIGWSESGRKEDVIDFTDGYVPAYNVNLYCIWEAKEYTIHFVIGNLATMQNDTDYVLYGKGYSFETPVYTDKSHELVCWVAPDGREIEPSGNWTYLMDTNEFDLTAKWRLVPYTLNYDTENGAVTVSEESHVVYYGQSYTLAVPEKEGYIFKGWSLSGSTVLLTDDLGVGKLPWQENGATIYTLKAQWTVLSEIEVTLYFDATTVYKTFSVTFGQTFSFPYDVNEIAQNEWVEKADIFCGWYDAYDSVNGSGYGKRYTDEEGNGLFGWDIGQNAVLYAQWPLMISDGAVLESLSGDDLTRSIVLQNDITVSHPIGSGNEPYSGTFNGRDHTITFSYDTSTDPDFDGYVGLFAYNKGILKNFVLVADIVVNATVFTEEELYVGTVAGRNDGKVVSVSNGNSNDVTATIEVNCKSESVSFIGGLIGYNTGVLSGVGMLLSSLAVSVDGEAFDKDLHEYVNLGLVFGMMDGGQGKNEGRSFSYMKAGEDDPYQSLAVCGATVGAPIVNIAMTFLLA